MIGTLVTLVGLYCLWQSLQGQGLMSLLDSAAPAPAPLPSLALPLTLTERNDDGGAWWIDGNTNDPGSILDYPAGASYRPATSVEVQQAGLG